MKTNKKDIFLNHQINIALKTIKIPEAILNVMGDMTKKEAKEILIKNNIKYEKR